MPSQRTAKSNKFPDLYSLLQLDGPDAETKLIKAAVRDLAAKAKKYAAAGKEQDAQRLSKIAALAQANLLENDRKAAYDQRWRTVYGSAGNKTDWRWDQLDEVLPQGDPDAAFDMAAYLENEANDQPVDHNEEFGKLNALLGGKDEPAPSPTVTAVPVSEVSLEAATQNAAVPVTAQQSPQSVAAVPTGTTAVAGAPAIASSPRPTASASKKPASLARKIRKKRERSMLLAAAGILLGVGGILGVMLFLLKDDEKPEVTNTVAAATNNNGNPAPATPAVNAPRTGSGLPKVQGLQGDQPDGSGADQQNNTQNPDAVATPQTDMSAPMQPSDPGMAGQSPPAMENTVANDDKAPQNSSSAITVVPVSELTDEQKNTWKDAMLAWRKLLAEHEYQQVQDGIDSIREQAVTRIQQDQLVRLTNATTYAKDCQAAIADAASNLSAGETFTAGGSTPISFVEGSTEHLVVRIQGRNQRFELTQLPLGIAWGLADLRLDQVHPSTKVRKAAFALFHAKTNQLGLNRAKGMWQSAVDEGYVKADSLAVFDDDYEL